MQLIVIAVSGLLVIATKFADCWTTHSRMKRLSMETNPLASWLMRRHGIKTVVWGVFLLAVLIVLVTGILTALANRWATTVAFAFLSLVVSLFQAAVAHGNVTGRLNFLTRLVLWLHGRMSSIKGR